jgi:hypothetical protein
MKRRKEATEEEWEEAIKGERNTNEKERGIKGGRMGGRN